MHEDGKSVRSAQLRFIAKAAKLMNLYWYWSGEAPGT